MKLEDNKKGRLTGPTGKTDHSESHDFDETMRIAEQLMVEYAETFKALAELERAERERT